MIETIARGEISGEYPRGDEHRRTITWGRYVAVLDMRHTATGDVWLLTGFEESRRLKRGPGVAGQPVAASQDYAPQPRGSSAEAGAEPSGSIESDEDNGNSPTEGNDTKYSLFNLRRQAAPMMAQPAQNMGSDLQQRLRGQIRGTTDVPYRQRLRDAIHGYDDRRMDRFKQAAFDRFHAVKALARDTAELGPWKALQLTKNLRSVMAVVLRHGPLEVYNDPKLGKWFRAKEGWTGGGFEQLFKPLADRGELEQWKDWAWARREQRFHDEDKGKPREKQRYLARHFWRWARSRRPRTWAAPPPTRG